VRSKQDFWGNPGKVLIATPLHNPLSDLHQEFADLGPDAQRAKTFTTYSKLGEKCTLRQVSYDSDIINAFIGTFTVLNESFHSDILCGPPASTLDLALPWAPAGQLPRRGHTLGRIGNLANMEGRPVLDHLLATNRATALVVWGPDAVPTFDDKIDTKFPSWS
jgi:hypothetical protein